MVFGDWLYVSADGTVKTFAGFNQPDNELFRPITSMADVYRPGR